MEAINWTKGIDQKTGLPIDYDPNRDIQVYSGLQNQTMTDRTKKLCPSHEGGNNYWSASFSQKTQLLYIPSRPTCNEMTMTPDQLRNPTTGSMLGGGIRLLEADRIRDRGRRSVHGRGQEQGARRLSELQRRADNRRRAAFHGLGRRDVHGLRRYEPGVPKAGGASSFELLRYLFTNAPRQIVVVDYASRLVVEYHVTGIFPAATGPAVMGDVLNFQPSHNLEKNEQAKKNQKNLAAAPRDKAPRSAPPLFFKA